MSYISPMVMIELTEYQELIKDKKAKRFASVNKLSVELEPIDDITAKIILHGPNSDVDLGNLIASTKENLKVLCENWELQFNRKAKYGYRA